MPVVLILAGLPDGGSTAYDGQYLRDFDHEAAGGRGEAVMTRDIRRAKTFENGMEAFQFVQKVPKNKPVREDGKPNRPLAATNWEMRAVGMADEGG